VDKPQHINLNFRAVGLYDKRHKSALTLPSGTSNRSIAEVLGAAHVVTNLLELHGNRLSGGNTARSEELRDYLEGCRKIIRTQLHALTPVGKEIATRLGA
jgi:hypothetical protein